MSIWRLKQNVKTDRNLFEILKAWLPLNDNIFLPYRFKLLVNLLFVPTPLIIIWRRRRYSCRWCCRWCCIWIRSWQHLWIILIIIRMISILWIITIIWWRRIGIWSRWICIRCLIIIIRRIIIITTVTVIATLIRLVWTMRWILRWWLHKGILIRRCMKCRWTIPDWITAARSICFVGIYFCFCTCRSTKSCKIMV